MRRERQKQWLTRSQGGADRAAGDRGRYLFAFAQGHPVHQAVRDQGRVRQRRSHPAALARCGSPAWRWARCPKVEAADDDSTATVVTMEIKDEALPIHEDAELKIRPRIFLEGNFFVDLKPGTPGAAEMDDGDTIPLDPDQRAGAARPGARHAAERTRARTCRSCSRATARRSAASPTPGEDADQDPDTQGETAGESLNDSLERRRRGAARHGDRQRGAARHRAARPAQAHQGQRRRSRRRSRSREDAAQGPDHELQHHDRRARGRAGQPAATRSACCPRCSSGQPGLRRAQRRVPADCARSRARSSRACARRRPRSRRRSRGSRRPARSCPPASSAAWSSDLRPAVARPGPVHRRHRPASSRRSTCVNRCVLEQPAAHGRRRDPGRQPAPPGSRTTRSSSRAWSGSRASRRTSTATAATPASRPAAATRPCATGAAAAPAGRCSPTPQPAARAPARRARPRKPPLQAHRRLLQPEARPNLNERADRGRPVSARIRKHLRDFLAILFLVVVAAGVAGYILSNQRFYLPAWVPVVGTDFYDGRGRAARPPRRWCRARARR